MKSKKVTEVECKTCECNHKSVNTSGNSVYGLGVIGTAFYFLQHATSFTDLVMGIVQAIFWPAIMVYHALTLLKL